MMIIDQRLLVPQKEYSSVCGWASHLGAQWDTGIKRAYFMKRYDLSKSLLTDGLLLAMPS
jgi:hypothetical protein